MKKKLICLLSACLLLSSCAAPRVPAPSAQPAANGVSGPVHPTMETSMTAPIGDAGLSYAATATLFLPSHDRQQLLTVHKELEFTYSLHPAETILRALLTHPGDSRVSPVCCLPLMPAGSDPVEVSGGVATVSLSANALELPREELHTVCRAIAATLCELPEVTYVNILAGGAAVGMDEAGLLPLGAITAAPGQELPVLWELLQARRVPEGTLATAVPLSAAVTLYFPLRDGSGVIPEARYLSFDGQHPQQLALGLLDALSSGPQSTSDACDFPALNQLMIAVPEVTELPEGSLRLTLRFTGDLRSWLGTTGADPACSFAALVMTMSTFIPGLQEIVLYTGERAVTSVVSPQHGSRLFPGGRHTRADYSGFLMAQARIHLPGNGRLQPLQVSLPYRNVQSPRALLLALSAREHALLARAITDADILGLAVQGDTLLINLSERSADALRRDPDSQRLSAYAIVNTMCRGLGVRRVRFFFGGETVQQLGGSLIWSGEFLLNPGLIQ